MDTEGFRERYPRFPYLKAVPPTRRCNRVSLQDLNQTLGEDENYHLLAYLHQELTMINTAHFILSGFEESAHPEAENVCNAFGETYFILKDTLLQNGLHIPVVEYETIEKKGDDPLKRPVYTKTFVSRYIKKLSNSSALKVYIQLVDCIHLQMEFDGLIANPD